MTNKNFIHLHLHFVKGMLELFLSHLKLEGRQRFHMKTANGKVNQGLQSPTTLSGCSGDFSP